MLGRRRWRFEGQMPVHVAGGARLSCRDRLPRRHSAQLLYIAADDLQGKEIWSVGIGAPGQMPQAEKFNSHAVCTVPSLWLLIDTTMYQAIRPHWAGLVGGMVAISYHKPSPNQLIHGCASIAGC